MKEITDPKIEAWALLMRTQRVLLENVEQALKAAGFPALVWYDVLLELERTDDGLRQFELGERMLLSKHNLSRLLDRMAKQSLLSRVDCSEDGRGSVIQVSLAGKRLRKSMWPIYADALNKVFASRLTDRQARELSNTLRSLRD